MIISRFEYNECTYFSLHAEQVYEDFILDTSIGIFQKSLLISTINRLEYYINKNPIATDYIVFDFNNIEIIQPNQSSRFKENILDVFCKEKQVLLHNIPKVVAKSLYVGEYITHDATFYEEIKLFKDDINTKKIISIDNAFDLYFVELLKTKGYISDEEDKLNPSSKVIINKFIDIKKFISQDKDFFIFAVYRLALSMISNNGRKWTITSNTKDIILFAQNMNSAYIASILSSFLQLDVLLIDHLGPKNKLYMVFDNMIKRNKKYLVVSDMVCMGTEVRLAKNSIEFSGAEYLGNVSIVRINTTGKDIYNNTESLYTVSKDNNSFKYSIKTALD